MFDSHLTFYLLSRKTEQDSSFHKSTTFYRIKPIGGDYIIEVEEYIHDTYVVKYYPAKFKTNVNKYRIITGSNVMNIVLGTCLKIFEGIYAKNAKATFGFVATASIIGKDE